MRRESKAVVPLVSGKVSKAMSIELYREMWSDHEGRWDAMRIRDFATPSLLRYEEINIDRSESVPERPCESFKSKVDEGKLRRMPAQKSRVSVVILVKLLKQPKRKLGAGE